MRFNKVGVRVKDFIGGNASIWLLFAAWELLPRYGVLDPAIIPSFSSVVGKLYGLAVHEDLAGHILISLQRAGLGFVLAAVTAIPLGFILGKAKILRRLLLPFLQLLEKINPFALFPVFILLLGISEMSKITMIFWVCQWPILFNTLLGARNVDPLLIKSARSTGAEALTLFYKVTLPASLPGIFNGLKIGAQIAFIMVIAAEMLGASQGLGWLAINGQQTYLINQLFGATLCIALIGFIINLAFTFIEGRLLGWREAAFHGNED